MFLGLHEVRHGYLGACAAAAAAGRQGLESAADGDGAVVTHRPA